MSQLTWNLNGEYMESCNCDFLCPCVYTNPQAPVTYDHCTALMVFRIDAGTADGVDLAGLKFGLIFKSGKVMGAGGWVFGVIVDAAASTVQRQALTAIASGDAGGPPGMIRKNLVTDFRGVEYQPIEFVIDGVERTVTIGDKLRFAIAGVLSRLGNGEPFYLDNVGHPAARKLALARSQETHLHCFGLDLDLEGAGNNGHYAKFAWAA